MPPSVYAEMTLPLLFCSLFLFQLDSVRIERNISRSGAAGMCVNGQRGGTEENLAAFPLNREYLFTIGGAAVFHISIVLFWNIGSPSCYK